MLRAYLLQFNVCAVRIIGVGLKPPALTLEVVWLEGSETTNVIFVKAQFALEGLLCLFLKMFITDSAY